MSSSAIRRQRGPAGSDSLATYLQEIRAYPLLSRDEELALARRIRAGDEVALDRLVCANLRFVVSVAKKYQNQGVTLSDLINEGNLGLLRAAEKFDDARGVKFITYAVWWIRQAIVHGLAEQAHAVRVPMSRVGLLHRIATSANSLRQELGREPTQFELAAETGIDAAEIESTVPIARAQVSLDGPLSDDEDVTLLDFFADDVAPSADEDVADAGLASSVDRALSRLRDREAMVLRLYFGFDDHDPMTLESIGEQLGVTRERVRQIKEKALAKLRRSDQIGSLEAFRAL